jgi:hypothetical protein
LYEEICVALGQLIPRYALWLHVGELGMNPERLSRSDSLLFCRDHLDDFLFEHGNQLHGRAVRRLRKRIERFDPELRTPYEHMARLSGPVRREP